MTAAASRSPRTVFGLVAYGRDDTLARTLESLLSQTTSDLAIVIVDDRPGPEVQAIVDRYRAADGRVIYEPNPTRLGMVANKRHAFARARALFPRMEYFAWVSDHDRWHPRWLEVLSGVLDREPDVVLAYPCIMRVYTRHCRLMSGNPDTVGELRRARRLLLASTKVTAGNAIYGLFRAAALARVGVFRPVLAPDRQVLAELSLFGQFKEVPDALWYREVAGSFSYARQRRMLLAGRPPLHMYLPAPLQHACVVLWDLTVRGRGRPELGRLAGAAYAVLQLWYTSKREFLRSGPVTRFRLWWRAPDAKGAAGEPVTGDVQPQA
jgi:glycosyltransferase involved in cell wall biosynthesis